MMRNMVISYYGYGINEAEYGHIILWLWYQ